MIRDRIAAVTLLVQRHGHLPHDGEDIMVTEAERNTPDDELIAALREYLDYDAETGALTWRLPPAQCVKSGSLAGSRL